MFSSITILKINISSIGKELCRGELKDSSVGWLSGGVYLILWFTSRFVCKHSASSSINTSFNSSSILAAAPFDISSDELYLNSASKCFT